jgi:uncharacterized RDD family membrane protein YckC
MDAHGTLLRRILAALLDSVFVVCLFVSLALVDEGWGFFGELPSIVESAVIIAGLGSLFSYWLLIEGLIGQTPGKLISGIVVVKTDGSPCTISASIIRNLLMVFDALLFGIPGLLLILVTERNQRLGDLAAGTVVVRTD